MTDKSVVRSIVETATRAPSVHNTQPWRFIAHDAVIELWRDPDRSVPVLDPAGRAAHLSCGAALLFARVDAAARGVAVRYTLGPTVGTPDHLADLILEAGSHAQDLADLRPAIEERHTERGEFDESAPVTPDAIRTLADAAQAEGCWLRVIATADDTAAVTVLLARADDVQSRNGDYRDELRRWTNRPADSVDGIPTAAVPAGPPQERGSNYRLRDFDADRDTTGPRWAGVPPRPEHPTVVILGTAEDDPTSWLRAGQALGRVLLAATRLGLVASPMTQAMEVEDTRARLVHELNLVGHPQMVLRVGHPLDSATSAAGRSMRRPVDEILETR